MIGKFLVVILGVGNDSDLGAGAVATKNVRPYAIVTDVPSKICKFRFDEDVIVSLLEIKWWNWDSDKQFGKEIDYFRSPFVKRVLEKINDK